MTEQHTSLIFIAFFFFFSSYYLALVVIFFIADVFTKVLTIEFMLFCGRSFIIYGFFWVFNAYYAALTYCWLYSFYCFYVYYCGEYFLPCRGYKVFISIYENICTLQQYNILVREIERRSVVGNVVCLLSCFYLFTRLAGFI